MVGDEVDDGLVLGGAGGEDGDGAGETCVVVSKTRSTQ
jgi:hypothetical protein